MQRNIRALVGRHYDAFNAHDLEGLAANVADDFTVHLVAFGLTFRGRAGMIEFARMWFRAFPDLHVEVKNLVVEGDIAVTELVATGTNRGGLRTPFGEIPASGQSARIEGVDVARWRGHKLATSSMHLDLLGLFTQLGVVSPGVFFQRPEEEPAPAPPTF